MRDGAVGELADVRPQALLAQVARGRAAAQAHDVGAAEGGRVGRRGVGSPRCWRRQGGCGGGGSVGVEGGGLLPPRRGGAATVAGRGCRRRGRGRRSLRVPRRHEHLDGLAVLRIDPRVRDQPRQQVDAVDGRVAGEGLGQLDDVLDLAVFFFSRRGGK